VKKYDTLYDKESSDYIDDKKNLTSCDGLGMEISCHFYD